MEDQQNNIQDDGAGAPPRTPDADDVIASAASAAEATPSSGAPVSELEALKKESADNLAGWHRALADYANLKRESEKGAVEIGKYATAGVVTALLPILDSFNKAHAAFPADATDVAALTKWAEGIGLIKSQLDSAMKRLGLAVIDVAGVPFDLNQHEAMMMQPATPEAPPGTVVKVLETGYKMHDRVLRPAKVVVAE